MIDIVDYGVQRFDASKSKYRNHRWSTFEVTMKWFSDGIGDSFERVFLWCKFDSEGYVELVIADTIFGMEYKIEKHIVPERVMKSNKAMSRWFNKIVYDFCGLNISKWRWFN